MDDLEEHGRQGRHRAARDARTERQPEDCSYTHAESSCIQVFDSRIARAATRHEQKEQEHEASSGVFAGLVSMKQMSQSHGKRTKAVTESRGSQHSDQVTHRAFQNCRL